MIALLGTAAVFCTMMAIYYWLEIRIAKQQTRKVLEKYVGTPSKLHWSDAMVERLDKTNWAKRLEPQLKRASIKLRPAEYGALLVLISIFISLFLKMGMKAPFLISVIVGVSVTFIASSLFLSSRKFIYVQRIDAQLSEVCRLLSSTARAGLSIPQGLELVVKEMSSPIRDELGIVVRELRLGRNLEVSLKDMLTRVNSRDLKVFVNALIIQRRAGGDLARVLAEMARTMEERKIIHKTIDASIAQSRYSAYLLPFISIIIVLIMSQMVNGFFDLFTSFVGIVILIIFIGMQVLGFLLIKRFANIKI